jgi:hypothetical protein
LTNSDIEPIRITANDPMPSLRLLLDVFCLILDHPVSYERSGQKLLMDPYFIQIIVSRVTTMMLSPELLSILRTCFDNDALNPGELESITPALIILFDWIEVVCKVGIMFSKLDSFKKLLEDKQRQFNEYVEEMNWEKASIEQVELTLENERQALESSVAAREQTEQEYRDVDARKKSIDSLFKGTDDFTERWQFGAS